MNIKFYPIVLTLLALIVPVFSQDKGGGLPIPLPQEKSDLPSDTQVKWGLLKNGMRYAILTNEKPKNRVSLRLFVDAGSFMENDAQQGVAHFLEHMAFNGTKSFPAGEMIEYFQRLGMGFGSDSNAYTSYNETVYKLEMPNTDGQTIRKGFQLLYDYADGMSLDSAEIDRERGVILSEKRSGDSVEWRKYVEQLKFVFPEHRVSTRLPIGREEVIEAVPRERFVEFYKDWYTPNRMAIIVVGDVEIAVIEKMIHEQFDELPVKIKQPDVDLGEIKKRKIDAHFYYEEEAAETTVAIEAVTAGTNLSDNKARRTKDLKIMLATFIVDNRLERIIKKEESPISYASVSAGDFYDLGFALDLSIEADCKAENWEAALALIEQELRRIFLHGFTKAEMVEAKANILKYYKEMARQAATRQSKDLADQIASALASRQVFTNPKDDLVRISSDLNLITANQSRDALKNLWEKSHNKVVLVSGNVKIENPKIAILEAFNRSAKVAVAAPKEEIIGKFAYARLPKEGKIVERKEIEDIGITQLRFENNVRVNLKVTDFEDETINIVVRFGAGLLMEPKDQRGLSYFLESVFTEGGLDAHSHDDLERLFAGKSINVEFDVDEDAFALTGVTTPEDLVDQLLLIRAYLTNPGFREEAVIEFRRNLPYVYQQLNRTPEGIEQDEIARFLHSGDSRFGFPAKEVTAAITVDAAEKWIAKDLAIGYMEVTVIGDFDKEPTIGLLAKTLGSLPERQMKKPTYAIEREVEFPSEKSKIFEIESAIPKASVSIYWPTVDIYAITKTRQIALLGAIFADRLRLKLREELSEAYSPVCYNLPSDTWTGYGYLLAAVVVEPAQAESVSAVIREIASDLATGSISEDELQRAKKPRITKIIDMRRSNSYWMGSVIKASQEYPQRLDWSRNFIEGYKKITAEEVNAMAKEFLTDKIGVTVIVKPKSEK